MKSDRRIAVAHRAAGVSLLTTIILALTTPTAYPQGIFENLSDPFRRTPAPVVVSQVSSYAEPQSASGPMIENKPTTVIGGPWVAYCVRLCDGRFFPLARSFAISPAEQCHSFCPTAKTKIFGGSSINNASAADGSRYVNLGTAFLYRMRVVDGCTCNGRDAFGVARMKIAADPTLRAGDIVAVNGGFAAYSGSRSAARQSADFTPIARYSSIPIETRRKLLQTTVLSARTSAGPIAVPLSSESRATLREDRRAQLLR